MTVDAGMGVKDNSLWNQILGLFASVKGELRFAYSRERKVVEYRIKRFNELVYITNTLLKECYQLLQEKENRQWLLLGEDFDKAGISTTAIEELFVSYGNIFRDLNVHLIFNIPIDFYNSSARDKLNLTFDNCHLIPDTTVFYQDHSPNVEGRNALEKVLEARINLNLFEAGQINRLKSRCQILPLNVRIQD